jgi:hypothetical protein
MMETVRGFNSTWDICEFGVIQNDIITWTHENNLSTSDIQKNKTNSTMNCYTERGCTLQTSFNMYDR